MPNETTSTSSAESALEASLRERIADYLLGLENDPGRDKLQDQLYSVLNPASDEAAEFWKDAHDRVKATADEIGKYRLFPWSHPFMSALAFESVYAASLHFWLLAGKAESDGELKPSVTEHIRWQVKAFTKAIGASRAPKDEVEEDA